MAQTTRKKPSPRVQKMEKIGEEIKRSCEGMSLERKAFISDKIDEMIKVARGK